MGASISTKISTNGIIQAFKAGLVAKDFRQIEGMDYVDIYALIVRTTIISILFISISIYTLYVHQIDVKILLLNGDLDGEAYME